ncbi:sulfonate dioxygenase [Penicillium macrosclerotiorum]|uniref:sulfonate dioxygenase n=1 Tax=Penicillium macrosclerotiorum TaxID=303699 RepID=UPI002549BF74|nr:sulfonate dioxygenase [Penicillium macrosclerotiorum]KAJ5689743.1 sulfonate dioxygenase [Penicillium macrosclerotiorum]
MAHLESRKHISADSGTPITLHPHFNPKIVSHVPPEPVRQEIIPPRDRAFFADPEKKNLFAVARRIDLTESIGTLLENVQLSRLTETQLDELALLVNERGVVFFRDQDLTTDQQVQLFEHFAPSYSLLRMEEHPDVGGDTAWV